MNNYIYEYYQAITDGSIIAGKWIKAWYKIIVDGLESKRWFFDKKKADKTVRFMETFCHHHKGKLAPQTIKLELWQKAFLSVVFGIVNAKGKRQFTEVMLLVGRKNGKTLLGSGIAERICVLPEEYGQEVYFIAPKLEQANLSYDGFRQMIEAEPEIRALQKKRRTDTYFPSSNTIAKPIAFSSKKSDGLSVSFCLMDELASWVGDAGLKQYEVLSSSTGARDGNSLLLSITTSGYVDESIFDELVKRCTAVLNGDSREQKLAPFLYMIDDVSKWNDINEIAKAMPNLGVSVSVDYILEEIAKAEGSLSAKIEFMTKFCNVKQNSSLAWLPSHEIAKCSGEHFGFEDFARHYCCLGIDLSRTTDLSSATCLIQKKDGELYVINHFWLPSEKIEEASVRDSLPYKIYIERGLLSPSGDNVVDYKDCLNWCKDIVTKYKMYPVIVGYDRYNAQYLTNDLQQFGFKCDDVVQGFNLSSPIQELEGYIRDGKLHIGDNDLLKVHLLDTALKFSAEKERCRIVKLNHKAHIDGVASLLCAMTVRQKWWSELGKRLVNERR